MSVGRGARRSGSRAARRGTGRTAGEAAEAVWPWLCAYMVEHNGRSPSARQIAAALGGYSLGGVAKALARLEHQGRIRRGRYGEARGIEIVGARFVLPEGAGPPP